MSEPTIDRADADVRLPWARKDSGVPRRVLQPLQSFLSAEFAGAALLLLATIVALIWANSPWKDSYQAFWHTRFVVGIGSWSVDLDLVHWVNDGLMTLFFFVVGLEIKRELTTGELRTPRAAALPVIAALGGMVVPAALFLAVNAGGEGARGWAIPMATDIAFAVAVVTVFGRGLPSSLRTFLLALAIVDDIGAILVIAVFYSAGIGIGPLVVAAGAFALMAVAQRIHVRSLVIYAGLGLVVWLGVFSSGVHATIAGVLLGLATPSRPFQRPAAVSREAERVAAATEDDPQPPDAEAQEWLRLANLSREAVSPLARFEHALHPWTSLVIVPLFALANAGVQIGGGAVREALSSPVVLGIIVGLVVGKCVGVTGATWLAVRTRVAVLPEGVRWAEIVAVGATAGIGFTVALFISHLAFPLDDTPTIGVLVASVLAAGVSAALLRRAARHRASSPANPASGHADPRRAQRSGPGERRV